MGSFVGHIDESVFFILLAFWWMVNAFPAYIKTIYTKEEFISKLSYPLPGKRAVPLEAILKTLFPLAGLMGEICSEGLSLIDNDGNFRKLAQMQHMSIYTIFIVHGLIDILMSYGIPLPKGLDYISAAVSFLWYGMSFSFHAHMHGKAAMETMIHILPIPILYITAASALAELMKPNCFYFCIIRILCLLDLGTWFSQAAFVLYTPYPWPGSDSNPRWDQTNQGNVQYIVASFGFHLILSLVVLLVTYCAIFLYMKLANKLPYAFEPCSNGISHMKLLSHSKNDEDDEI